MNQSYPSELDKSLKQRFQCFAMFTLSQFEESKVPELASIQTKLLLQQNPEIPFGKQVSSDTISQLTKVFCEFGTTTFENENLKLKSESTQADRLAVTLRELLQKKLSHLHRYENEKKKILDTIQCFKKELMELKSKNEPAALPKLDNCEQMQNQFCEKLEEENEALRRKIDPLKEYGILEGITCNAKLERAIMEKEIQQNQYLQIDSPPPTKFESRLSFSFDESI